MYLFQSKLIIRLLFMHMSFTRSPKFRCQNCTNYVKEFQIVKNNLMLHKIYKTRVSNIYGYYANNNNNNNNNSIFAKSPGIYCLLTSILRNFYSKTSEWKKNLKRRTNFFYIVNLVFMAVLESFKLERSIWYFSKISRMYQLMPTPKKSIYL